MGDRREIWWTSRQQVVRQRAWLAPEETKKIQAGLAGLVGAFGALGSAAREAGMKFEDAAAALRALGEEQPMALHEPEVCAICDVETDRLVKHHLSTTFMRGIPIWTRICSGCIGEPLCPRHPWGRHATFISAEHPDFEISHTVVVMLGDLDRCGHCGDCGLPLIRDESHPRSWRYWTVGERAALL